MIWAQNRSLRASNVAVEKTNPTIIDDFPMNTFIYRGFPLVRIFSWHRFRLGIIPAIDPKHICRRRRPQTLQIQGAPLQASTCQVLPRAMPLSAPRQPHGKATPRLCSRQSRRHLGGTWHLAPGWFGWFGFHQKGDLWVNQKAFFGVNKKDQKSGVRWILHDFAMFNQHRCGFRLRTIFYMPKCQNGDLKTRRFAGFDQQSKGCRKGIQSP